MKIVCIGLFILGIAIQISAISNLRNTVSAVPVEGIDETKEYSLNEMVQIMNSFLGCILMCVSGLTLLI